MSLNLSASVGFIALFGVAMLNGVVLVSSINLGFDAGATSSGPAPSDTISQAAPTPCMNVPISETRSAVSKFRNIGTPSGLHAADGSPVLLR